jgi:hypothetical protein
VEEKVARQGRSGKHLTFGPAKITIAEESGNIIVQVNVLEKGRKTT